MADIKLAEVPPCGGAHVHVALAHARTVSRQHEGAQRAAPLGAAANQQPLQLPKLSRGYRFALRTGRLQERRQVCGGSIGGSFSCSGDLLYQNASDHYRLCLAAITSAGEC